MLGCVRAMEWDNLVYQVHPDGVLETYFHGKFIFIFMYIYNYMIIQSYEDFFLPSMLPGNEKMSSTFKK